MFVAKLNVGAVALLVSCMLASLTPLSAAPPQLPAAKAEDASAVPSDDRLFAPERTLAYVNLFMSDPKADYKSAFRFARFVKDRLWKEDGMGVVRNLGTPICAFRAQLNPIRLRALKVSTEDIAVAMRPTRLFVHDDWLERNLGTVFKVKEHELIEIWYGPSTSEQFGQIIWRATEKGEILRLKDVGRAELAYTLFDVSSDIDGRPAATLIVKQAPGSDASKVLQKLKERLEDIKKNQEWWPPGMEFEIVPFEHENLIYAVVEVPRDSTRENTIAKCHELGAIARGIEEVTSVISLGGYQLPTESGAANAGTCLIRLKDQSGRKRTPQQILEQLEEKSRTIHARLKFFDQPTFSLFVANGGFSVRVLGKANSNNDEQPGQLSEAFLSDLLNRDDLAILFGFLAKHYRQYELVIDNDIATKQGVSIANALENLAERISGDVPAKGKFRKLDQELSHASIQNDRGEKVPYRVFIQLKNKLGLDELARKHTAAY